MERPGGDVSRRRGPFSDRSGHVRESLSFSYHNSNKHSVTLDIEHEEGRKILLALVQKNDVLVETFPPGHLERVGLGYDTLNRGNPLLIHLSLTGFGQTGPRRNYRSCGLVSSAYGGQMYVSGTSSGRPTPLFDDQPAYAACLAGAAAVLLAFRSRRKNGKGTYIDLSIQEAVTSPLDHVMVSYFHNQLLSKRLGSHYWNNVFHIFPCEDGHIQMTILYQWETLLEWMASEGMAGDLTDEAWQDEAHRVEHMDHIIRVMERWTRSHQTHELFELGQAMQFPWAPILSPEEVLDSPQLEARQFFIPEEAQENGATYYRPGMPYRLDGRRQRKWTPAPRPGQHNRQIFGEGLGLVDSRLDELAKAKVI